MTFLILLKSLTIDNEIDEVCIGRAPTAEYHLAVFAVSDSAVGCYYHQEGFLRPALGQGSDFALSICWKRVRNWNLLKNPKVDRVVAAIAQDFGLQFSYEFMYDECQSSIALNSMVNDRYNDSTPCYDAYVGLTCDNAYNPAAPIFKVHKTSPCTFLTSFVCSFRNARQLPFKYILSSFAKMNRPF